MSKRELTCDDPGLPELQINLQVCVKAHFSNGNISSGFVYELGDLHGAVQNTWPQTHTHASIFAPYSHPNILTTPMLGSHHKPAAA